MNRKPIDLDYHGEAPRAGASIVYWPTPNMLPGFASIREVNRNNDGSLKLIRLTRDPNLSRRYGDYRKAIVGTQYLCVSDMPNAVITGEAISEDAFGTTLHVGDEVLCSHSFMFNNAGDTTYNKVRVALVRGIIESKDYYGNLKVIPQVVRTISKHHNKLHLEEYTRDEFLLESINDRHWWSHLPQLKKDGVLVFEGHNQTRALNDIKVPPNRILAYRSSGNFFKRRLLF